MDKQPGVCVFCEAVKEDKDEEHFIFYRGRSNFLILNLYPYTAGHTMIVPYRHISFLSLAAHDELAEMMGLAKRCEEVLAEVYKPQGFNLGINLGRCAGAGIADHLHMHIVPRWAGDTNFVSVIGETRLIPEDIRTTYAKIRPFFANEAQPSFKPA